MVTISLSCGNNGSMRDLRPTDEQLLAVRSASEAGGALAEFYCRNERVVMAFYVRRVRDPELAADLTAATFLEVLKSRHRFRGDRPGDATAWLFGIAGHLLSRHWRREDAEARRRERILRDLAPLTHEQTAAIEGLAEDGPLMDALAALPAAQRDAVRAYVLGDRTYAEIAEQSEIEPAAARKRVSRGLRTLRAALKDHP